MKVDALAIRTEAYKKGVTQKAIAEACQLSRATVNGIFNGRGCSEETATKIATVLEVPVKRITK